KALQVGGERVRDLIFNLLRSVPGPVGKDDHLVVREVWNRVDRGRANCPPAPASQAEVERDHDETVLQCNVNEAIDHEPQHVSCRARTRTDLAHSDGTSEQTHDDCEMAKRGRRRARRTWERVASESESRSASRRSGRVRERSLATRCLVRALPRKWPKRTSAWRDSSSHLPKPHSRR